MKGKRLIAGAHWIVLAVTAGLFVVVATCVDLKPVVDENFFFSSSDPQYRQAKQAQKHFGSSPQIILSAAARDISSQHYLEKVAKLTAKVEALDDVTSVKSISNGPKSVQDAEASPFWNRLLIGQDRKSTNLILFGSGKQNGKLIPALEGIMRESNDENFHLHIAGPPYVVEMIARSLTHDFWYFSLTAIVLFGIVMALMFRSLRVFLGMLATCSSAVLLTLFIQSLFGRKIGVLTVNLGTIVFVITLSHLVYMTFNWQTLADRARRLNEKAPTLVPAARRMTLPASFWSMICAALGFGSLLLVEAKPLRELGSSGVLGSILAFMCAYIFYPPFLAWAVPRESKIVQLEPERGFWSRKFPLLSAATVLICVVVGFGLPRVNTDPKMVDYFKPHTDLSDGLDYIDRTGGSTPLTMVVSASDHSRLDTDAAYNRLWSLEKALEKNRNVGTAISLATVIAEADRNPMAKFFSTENIVQRLEDPKYSRVAKSFINGDRSQAVFLLRMNEERRTEKRVDVVNDLKAIAQKNGFHVVSVGGVYILAGRLAELIASSVITGLFWLNVLFIVIAFIVARTVRGTIAMIVSLALVPLAMLGGIGWFRVPIDVISSPATNVCIGIAIDSMIHLVFGVRRAVADGTKGWSAWVAAREEQWRGIVYSDVIIAAGFAIFVLSDFPPTQRFGLVVLAGCLVDILANLFVLPLLGGAELRESGAS
ncbi:MAG: efflux RND transporter permease subunit [Chthoniobacterales bacterium]